MPGPGHLGNGELLPQEAPAIGEEPKGNNPDSRGDMQKAGFPTASEFEEQAGAQEGAGAYIDLILQVGELALAVAIIAIEGISGVNIQKCVGR